MLPDTLDLCHDVADVQVGDGQRLELAAEELGQEALDDFQQHQVCHVARP